MCYRCYKINYCSPGNEVNRPAGREERVKLGAMDESNLLIQLLLLLLLLMMMMIMMTMTMTTTTTTMMMMMMKTTISRAL